MEKTIEIEKKTLFHKCFHIKNKELKEKILGFYGNYMVLIGCMGHLIFILQAYKVILNKNAENVSVEGIFIAFLSILSWLFYGIIKEDTILIKVNIFGFVSSLFCLSVIIFR